MRSLLFLDRRSIAGERPPKYDDFPFVILYSDRHRIQAGTMTDPRSRRPSRLSVALTIGFVVSILMGIGPGVLLVNRPATFLGLPLLYAWGIFWYLVMAVIALAAYLFIWQDAAGGSQGD
ncbi:hypothetical protein [Rubinisphaera margarita]|uniref:hypothetical protein n=1 Tax=Rubinisphaera margarita TaxID=2909586 RepID=UPI001EE85EF5|nr:hypothetical protein [Rubinisphaera margarita]MCG6156465.1 hypothetical protein [Rubinisphaera margarita]